MTQTTRQKRIRHLVHRLNRERKRQAKQVDILCNDLIGAQRDFLRRLATISHAATYYKAILGVQDVDQLYRITGQHIQALLPDVGIVFCLPNAKPWRFHHEGAGSGPDDLHMDQYLDADVIAAITQANHKCDTEDMLALGLQVNPSLLTRLKATTIPLTTQGRGFGFVLLSRSHTPLQATELEPIESIAVGLVRALAVAVSAV